MNRFVATVFTLLLLPLLQSCVSAPTPKVQVADAFLSMSLPELAKAIRSQEITAVALVEAYTARIREVDQSGPALRAVLAIDPTAIDRANALDALQAEGRFVGPLHGVPILLKDNIEARGPLATTAGSTALADNVTDRDSPLVTGLRNAGAIILGKTNLSQWANYRSNFSLSGWSSIGGQVKNPHILDRNPCGSSSGSGAAVAAALAAGAVGTETNGSIICPSNANGIVGFKPTVGLVSTEHIVPISFTQDTAGPMTRSVAGAALMLDAMAVKSKVDSPMSYVEFLQSASLKGKRLGVLRYAQGSHPGILKKFEAALLAMSAAGAELVDITQRPDRPPEFRVQARQVMSAEFKYSINKYLSTAAEAVDARSLGDLVAFNVSHAGEEMPLFGQDIFESALGSVAIDHPDYLLALRSIRQATQNNGIDALLSEHRLDALVFPSGPLVPAIDPINGDVWPDWVGDGATAAIAGYPHLTVPMGAVHGAPVGMSFVAGGGDDAKVLALGHAFEQATRLRVEPSFLPTATTQARVREAMNPLRK